MPTTTQNISDLPGVLSIEERVEGTEYSSEQFETTPSKLTPHVGDDAYQIAPLMRSGFLKRALLVNNLYTPLSGDKNGHRRSTNDSLRDTPEKDPGDSLPAVTSDEDQIDRFVFRLRDDAVIRFSRDDIRFELPIVLSRDFLRGLEDLLRVLLSFLANGYLEFRTHDLCSATVRNFDDVQRSNGRVREFFER